MKQPNLFLVCAAVCVCGVCCPGLQLAAVEA